MGGGVLPHMLPLISYSDLCILPRLHPSNAGQMTRGSVFSTPHTTSCASFLIHFTGQTMRGSILPHMLPRSFLHFLFFPPPLILLHMLLLMTPSLEHWPKDKRPCSTSHAASYTSFILWTLAKAMSSSNFTPYANLLCLFHPLVCHIMSCCTSYPIQFMLCSYSISTLAMKSDSDITIFYSLNGVFLSVALLLILNALDPRLDMADWGLAQHHHDWDLLCWLWGGSVTCFVNWRVWQWAEPRYHWWILLG